MTTYALVEDDIVKTVGALPASARRLDTGEWVMGLATAPTELVEACGWFVVTDTPPAYDPATEVLENGGVVVVAGRPVFDYTVRPKTAAEVEAEADLADRRLKGAQIGREVVTLRQWADDAEAVTVTSGNAVATLNIIIDRLAVFFDRFADLIEHQGLDRL
jgi:hypothetical protein